MLIALMASASLSCWVLTERWAQIGFGFSGAKGLGALIDNLPHLLAFMAAAGLAAQSPLAGGALLALHNAVLLALSLIIMAKSFAPSSNRQRARASAVVSVSGKRIWRMTCMAATILAVVVGVPLLALLEHLLR